MTTAKIRIQNGCFKSGNDYVIPGVGKISIEKGLQYFTKPGGLNSVNNIDLFNTNPKGGVFGNTIKKIETTQDTTEIEAWECPKPGEEGYEAGKPIKKPFSITNTPDGVAGTCSPTETGTGNDSCAIPGGKSCDITIESTGDKIVFAADYWQSKFSTGNLVDFECKGLGSYNSNYDTTQGGNFSLNQSDILVLKFGCGKCGNDETSKIKSYTQIDAIDLVPGGLEIDGCLTNPDFGYCNLLPVENGFF
jgi:hypothetical protein